MTTEELVDRLAGPIFIFRMARNSPVSGADKRKRQALDRIEKIVSEYKGEKTDG